MNTEILMKSRPTLIIIDVLILAGIIITMSLFTGHADIVLLFSYVITVLYSIITKRYLSLMHLMLSTIIAVGWVYFAKGNYGYNHTYFSIAGMNILPILAWALGLIGVSEIFNHFKSKRKLLNFILFIPVFWILLILIETYAFHVIEIRDTMSGSSIGLPFCNCIHAPLWMRIVYFSMGPVYYALTILADSVAIKYIKPDHPNH